MILSLPIHKHGFLHLLCFDFFHHDLVFICRSCTFIDLYLIISVFGDIANSTTLLMLNSSCSLLIQSNTIDFCLLAIYLTTFLNLLICGSHLKGGHLLIETVSFLSFQSACLLCFSLPYCTGQDFQYDLSRSGKRGHLCLVPNIKEESAPSFSLKYFNSGLFLQMAFVRLRKFAAVTSQMSFYSQWTLHFAVSWFFFFSWLTWCIMLVDFEMLIQPCIPGIM